MKLQKLILSLISLVLLATVVAGCQQEAAPAPVKDDVSAEKRNEGGGQAATRITE